MTLGTAVLLLVLAVAGIVLAFRYLRKKPKLRILIAVKPTISEGFSLPTSPTISCRRQADAGEKPGEDAGKSRQKPAAEKPQ